ncbi:MAG: hypothetical protein Q8P50_18890, partial [Bacillota bacterium]|nr:hypothetical protein [Bacillota bacterium]
IQGVNLPSTSTNVSPRTLGGQELRSKGKRDNWKRLVAHIWKIVWLNFRWTKTKKSAGTN